MKKIQGITIKKSNTNRMTFMYNKLCNKHDALFSSNR